MWLWLVWGIIVLVLCVTLRETTISTSSRFARQHHTTPQPTFPSPLCLQRKDYAPFMVDNQIVSHKQVLVLEQGGFGLGDHLIGLVNLLRLSQTHHTRVQLRVNFPLSTYCQVHPDRILTDHTCSSRCTSWDLTHNRYPHHGQLWTDVEHGLLDQELTQLLTRYDTIHIQSNLAFFHVGATSSDVTKLFQQLHGQFLCPRPRVETVLKDIVGKVDAIAHIRTGDEQLLFGKRDVGQCRQIAEHLRPELMNYPHQTRFYVSSDSNDMCLAFMRKYPQFHWTQWNHYQHSGSLSHSIHLTEESNQFRTITEMLLFAHIPYALVTWHSNFNKVGLLSQQNWSRVTVLHRDGQLTTMNQLKVLVDKS